jgi:hypothetical protein
MRTNYTACRIEKGSLINTFPTWEFYDKNGSLILICIVEEAIELYKNSNKDYVVYKKISDEWLNLYDVIVYKNIIEDFLLLG